MPRSPSSTDSPFDILETTFRLLTTGPNPLADACDLNGALHEALTAFFDVLESYTIADLAGKRRVLRQRLGLGLDELIVPAAAH